MGLRDTYLTVMRSSPGPSLGMAMVDIPGLRRKRVIKACMMRCCQLRDYQSIASLLAKQNSGFAGEDDVSFQLVPMELGVMEDTKWNSTQK